MARKLKTTVHIHNEDGTSTAYGPDDTVPADVAKRIENADVWGLEDDDPTPEKPAGKGK